MFSIKFTGPVISSAIFFLKFLACASLKNYKKKTWKISTDPLNMMLNIGLMYSVGMINGKVKKFGVG